MGLKCVCLDKRYFIGLFITVVYSYHVHLTVLSTTLAVKNKTKMQTVLSGLHQKRSDMMDINFPTPY